MIDEKVHSLYLTMNEDGALVANQRKAMKVCSASVKLLISEKIG